MHRLLAYLGQLTTAKQVLWCYLIWYLTMVGFHFDPSPRLWMTSLGISAVIGFGLILSVSSGNAARCDFWTTMRLFLMPLCVSSFSALVKDQGFILILSPRWREDALALSICVAFICLCYVLRTAPATSTMAKENAAE